MVDYSKYNTDVHGVGLRLNGMSSYPGLFIISTVLGCV